MDKKEKFVIFTGGFALYFFIALILVFLVPLLFVIRDIIIAKLALDIRIFFGLLVMLWGVVYMIMFLKSNRIELTEEKIVVSVVDRTLYKAQLVPKAKKVSVDLRNIETILLAEARDLDKLAKIQKDKDLKEDLDKFKQTAMLPTGKTTFPLDMWVGLKYTPLLRIVKKQGKPLIVDTKPFSKRDFWKLINVLQEKDVSIDIYPGINLQRNEPCDPVCDARGYLLKKSTSEQLKLLLDNKNIIQ